MVNELEETVRRQTELVNDSVRVQEKTMKEHVIKVEKSLQEFSKSAKEQVKVVEQSLNLHKASYSEAVKGTCSEVTSMVKSQLATLPKGNQRDNKPAQDLSKVLDDHMDRERSKANIVIHNLPEQEGDSVTDRAEKDLAIFSTMINLRPGGGGGHFGPPPLWFFEDNSKTKREQRNQTWHTFSLINFTSVVKFLCRGHIRSGHQVESRDLTSKKVYTRATATVLDRIFSSFQNLIRPLVPTICISRIFDISMTWGQVKILTSPL